ncbi:hypothetical protein D3C81_2065070 [compost metagenome]
MRPVTAQTVGTQHVIPGTESGVMLHTTVNLADGQGQACLVVAAISVFAAIQIKTDLERLHVIVVRRGVAKRAVMATVPFAAAENHPAPAE